jgi:hypothetical protein
LLLLLLLIALAAELRVLPLLRAVTGLKRSPQLRQHIR